MTSIILDTNSYSRLVRGEIVIQKVLENADIVYISTIVIGELYAGFINGNKFEKNNIILNKLLAKKKVKLLEVNKKISFKYGELFVNLTKSGKRIPTNDIWIAASAIETDSTLITYDNHFLNIPKLKLWNGIKKISS